MRIFSIFFLSLIAVCLSANNPLPFIIEGKVGSAENDSLMIHLIYRDANMNTVQDSCLIQNGRYHFKGETEYTFFGEMYIARFEDRSEIAHEDIYAMYIDQGTMTVESPDYLWNSTVSGSNTNDLKGEFELYLLPLQMDADVLNLTFQEAPPEVQNDPVFIDSLNREFEVISNEFYNAAMEFIANHPDDILSVFLLQDHLSGQPNDENVEQVFNVLSDSIKNTPVGRRLANTIRMYKTLETGTEAPDFTINDVKGNPVTLSSLRGKYVFLVFWSPTCNHCLSEIPNMKKAYELYKDKGFEIISFALANENDRQLWINTVEDNAMPWPNISDLKEWDSEVFQSYKAYSVPKNYLIGPDGKIIAKELYGNALQQKLAEVFQ